MMMDMWSESGQPRDGSKSYSEFCIWNRDHSGNLACARSCINVRYCIILFFGTKWTIFLHAPTYIFFISNKIIIARSPSPWQAILRALHTTHRWKLLNLLFPTVTSDPTTDHYCGIWKMPTYLPFHTIRKLPTYFLVSSTKTAVLYVVLRKNMHNRNQYTYSRRSKS